MLQGALQSCCVRVRLFVLVATRSSPRTLTSGQTMTRPAQVYFDKMLGVEPYKAQACTPYHTCCFLALCGEVYVLAPHPVMANCCCLNTCPCLFKMYPGLEDAQALVDFTKAARDDFAMRKGAPVLQLKPLCGAPLLPRTYAKLPRIHLAGLKGGAGVSAAQAVSGTDS